MISYFIVFLGAGIGGSLRHGVNNLAKHFIDYDYPFSTMAVNIIGSLFMGCLVGWFAFKGDATQPWRLFLTTGVLGGFTTFSTFSLEIALLYERGNFSGLALYLGGSIALSIAALALGLWVMRSIG